MAGSSRPPARAASSPRELWGPRRGCFPSRSERGGDHETVMHLSRAGRSARHCVSRPGTPHNVAGARSRVQQPWRRSEGNARGHAPSVTGPRTQASCASLGVRMRCCVWHPAPKSDFAVNCILCVLLRKAFRRSGSSVVMTENKPLSQEFAAGFKLQF